MLDFCTCLSQSRSGPLNRFVNLFVLFLPFRKMKREANGYQSLFPPLGMEWNERISEERRKQRKNSSLPFVVNFLLRLHTLQLLTVIGKSFIFPETNGRWMKWQYHSRTEVLQIKSRHMLEWRSQLKNYKFSSKYAFPDRAQHEVEVKERGKHEWSNKVGEKLGKTDKNLFENFLFAFVSGANDSSSHNWLTVVLQREKKSNSFLPIALYAHASSIFIVRKKWKQKCMDERSKNFP